jgi:Tfp pilus assembly protein PilZ
MATEKRRHERLNFQGRIFLELRDRGTRPDEPEVVLCRTVDISRSGLRVGINRVLTIGTILQIGVELAEDKDPLYLTGEVMWCQMDGERPGQFQVGFALLNAKDSDIDNWRDRLTEMGSD